MTTKKDVKDKHEKNADEPTQKQPAKKSGAKTEKPEKDSQKSDNPVVSVVMGSQSDWKTMRNASKVLTRFGVAHECLVVSAHRTPAWLTEFASNAESRGIQVVIAGAGGAAHLPGMVAAQTTLPVLGVPIKSKALKGKDSLLSIVQMPAGIPVGTLAIGDAGATNAALLAVSILGLSDAKLNEALKAFRQEQTESVMANNTLEPADDSDDDDD
jgi:5-(carboxyamino)imidazole ribonucleotide mutase